MGEPIQSARSEERALLQMELLLSVVLRYGVLLCLAIISLGVGLRLLHLGSVSMPSEDLVRTLLSGDTIKASPLPVSLSGFWNGVVHLDADVITASGLALLIGLPVFRVAMTVVLFAIERDRIYFVITALVLSILLSGFYFGKAL